MLFLIDYALILLHSAFVFILTAIAVGSGSPPHPHQIHHSSHFHFVKYTSINRFQTSWGINFSPFRFIFQHRDLVIGEHTMCLREGMDSHAKSLSLD